MRAGPGHEALAVGCEERRRDQDHRVVAGARRVDDRRDRGGVADHELMKQLLGERRRHGATIERGADTALTPRSRPYTFDVFQISVLGPVEVRRDGQLVPVPAGKTSELLVRLALEAGLFVRADRLVDDLWADGCGQHAPQHAAVEGRQAAPGARRSVGDRQRRRRLHARRRAVRGRCARRVARRAPPRPSCSTPATTAAPPTCARRRWSVYRGDVLQAAGDGDWVAPHRARLEEARMKLVETQFSARLRLGDVGRRDRRAGSGGGDVPATRRACGSC